MFSAPALGHPGLGELTCGRQRRTLGAVVEVAERFLAALARRDWDGVAACFAAEGTLRMQSPGPLREEHGAEAVAARYRFWFGDLDGFELRESDAVPIVDRVRVHYRVAGNGKVTDHTGYLAVEDGRIAWIVLSCSGFREERR